MPKVGPTAIRIFGSLWWNRRLLQAVSLARMPFREFLGPCRCFRTERPRNFDPYWSREVSTYRFLQT